jgi:hypothetical protein
MRKTTPKYANIIANLHFSGRVFETTDLYGRYQPIAPAFRLVRFTDLGKLNFPMVVRVLDSSQFSILPQLHQKTMLASKGVKIVSKISNHAINLNP